ncbi:Microtubule-actin cross-linking factor 1 [Camelus dromedarius]|uniref:Microtubule-actin cross-linking factor 1 n=1 Tax=Camelus dromedarius TaxID=9838 RepID=A0A5N4CGK6_CAMDR|nr:Microtubule-actin cross-linking factor 1 [Camelus dromedarius]
MEELQASQGPLAPDVTVAVAQLREQKLLRRLLEERALQVELRLQEAQSPGQLRARWDGLVQRAEARWGLLEQLVPAARSFEVAHSALLALLTPGEQLLAELWQDQLGPEGCKGAVQRLQGVCEGAAARTEGLERALEAGQRLAELLAAVFRKEVELLGGCWSEAQKQDTRLKAIRGPVELAASEEGLQPEGSWAQALQVFPWELWGEWTLSASLLWREPALPGRATGRGTCHLGLLLEPQGCRAMASSSTTERPRVLEGTVMLAAPRFAEELLTLPTRLSQAEPHGPKPGPVARGCGRHSHLLDQAGVVMMALLPGVLRPPSLHQDSECPSDLQVVQARGWGLEEWPVALGAAGLKPWTRAPGKALTLRDPGQGQPEDLRSRTVTRASLGGLLEDLSWRPPQGVGATRRGAGGTRTSGHDVGRGSHAQPPTSCSEELARTRVSWLGGHAACNGLATGSTSPPPSRTLWTVASGPKPGPPPPVPAQVSRGALMVRVGGGWVALDEYLVKYDPGRAKGRTNQKIHERFLSWAVAPSLPAPAVVPERLWASILCTTGSPLSRKTDWKCAGIRDPISSTPKAE